MLDKSKIMKKWNELNNEQKQMIGIMAGVSASLFLRGILNMKVDKKSDMEVINLVVPKDAELMIFVKGGK